MSPTSYDIPSVIRIPSDLDGISEFVRTQIVENNPSVIVLDLDQGTAVIQTQRQEPPELSKDSLPFLLSNHTLEISISCKTIEGCIEAAEKPQNKTLMCIFLNPEHDNLALKSSVDIFYSTIVTGHAVVGYYEDDKGVRDLNLFTIGD